MGATAGMVFGFQALADPIPQAWRKTMTDDPATNRTLQAFATPMTDSLEETGRIITLARILGGGCRGATVDRQSWSQFIEGSGIRQAESTQLKAISDASGSRFDGLDVETLAHLCSGITYLFGAEGVLVKNLLTPGSGEPSMAYDPANPYLSVPPLYSGH